VADWLQSRLHTEARRLREDAFAKLSRVLLPAARAAAFVSADAQQAAGPSPLPMPPPNTPALPDDELVARK
jgi:hypothetical protein